MRMTMQLDEGQASRRPMDRVNDYPVALPRIRVSVRKRVFDLLLISITAPLWVPAVCLACLLILVLEGRPVFYISPRRVHGDRSLRLIKLRTMVRNAVRIANRKTLPIEDTCFLNIPGDSPLYTPIGRLIERFHLTELPQFVHVLSGRMSLVGNRPLPEDVIRALTQSYPWAEQRFEVRCGMTGAVQLVGRDNLSDEDRLTIETAYCRAVAQRYTMWLDLYLLMATVLISMRIVRSRSADDVILLLKRFSGNTNGELCRHATFATHAQSDALRC